MGLAFHCQYDGIAHWPKYISTDSCVECQRETNVHCIKCETPLCIKYNGEENCVINCFYHYHTTPKDKMILTPNFAPPHSDSSDQESDHVLSKSNFPHLEGSESDSEPCTPSTSH